MNTERELLIVSYNITIPEVLAQFRNTWRQRNLVVAGHAVLGRSLEDTKKITSDMVGGTIELIDPHADHIAVLAKIDIKAPIGLHYSSLRQTLYTGSDHWVGCVADGLVKGMLDNQFFNCIHSVNESTDGNLLITSTGIDAILKVNPDDPTVLKDSWFSTEHGFNVAANGSPRQIDMRVYHQNFEYSTREHTTHVNSALEFKPSLVLATFFHQGLLVEIDLVSGNHRVVYSGLKNPHNIRRASFGFIVSDTNGSRVVKFDQNLNATGEITGDFNWIQDAVELKNGCFAIADVNHGRIAIVDPTGRQINEFVYGADQKKTGSILALDANDCRKIFGSVGNF